MHIAIDLDEVLCETVNALLKFYNYEFNGNSISREEIVTYIISDIPGHETDFAYAKAWFYDYLNHYADLPDACVGSREVLKSWKDKGYTLSVITARSPFIEDLTNKWIDIHFPGLISEIHYASHFTADHRHKSDICKEIGATIMIEDNLGYSQELAENGIPTYLITKPWNQDYDQNIHHKDITKVSSWEEIGVSI